MSFFEIKDSMMSFLDPITADKTKTFKERASQTDSLWIEMDLELHSTVEILLDQS